jgi:hypothetical protein
MRDRRFVAEHRGGPLKKEQHRQLIKWACDCARHVLPLFGENIDKRLEYALKVAKEWERGNASVGDARNAAFGAIAVANENQNPASISIARAVGHAVATAHMADHAPGAAEYALKALASQGKSIDAERKWQDKQLPHGIKELVLSSRHKNKKFWQASLQKARKKIELPRYRQYLFAA